MHYMGSLHYSILPKPFNMFTGGMGCIPFKCSVQLLLGWLHHWVLWICLCTAPCGICQFPVKITENMIYGTIVHNGSYVGMQENIESSVPGLRKYKLHPFVGIQSSCAITALCPCQVTEGFLKVSKWYFQFLLKTRNAYWRPPEGPLKDASTWV